MSTESILAKMQDAAKALSANEPGAREQLLDLSMSLTSSLELPSEAIQRMFWAEPARNANLRLAIDLNLFQHFKKAGDQGISVAELARLTGADDKLLSRSLKHLYAMGIVGEKSPDTYTATRLSNAFTEDRYRSGIIYTYDVAGPAFHSLPKYLRNTDFALPTSLTDGPFQYAHDCPNVPFFGWLDQHPPNMQMFNNYMMAYRAGKPAWVDAGFYPIDEQLSKSFDKGNSDVFLVDVGGGLGHDLRDLASKHPNLPGRLILQDRQEVIATIPQASSAPFEATAHDFFTEQPVKGAKAYFLHSVLHDWGFDDCVRILQALKPAMKPGYSRLLINEIVVPDEKPTWPVTAMDQLMLVLGAMSERSEAQWTTILRHAGYKIVKIWQYHLGSESLIEAELM